MDQQSYRKSIILRLSSRFIEFANRHFTLAKWLFGSNKIIFFELEIMMVAIIAVCVGLLFFVDLLPIKLAIIIAILLFQRVFEFVIVYSRNFILHRGRIFSDFPDPQEQGEWLLMMFFMNIIQLVLVFAIWYRVLSLAVPGAFTKTLGTLDSLYFSTVTFLTIGSYIVFPLMITALI